MEDNDLNREIAVEILSSMGIAVDCAENGRGVDKFRASEIGTLNVVLMDLQMPVMNGLDACREIRKSCREDAGLPVFAMSANASREDVLNTREAGMNAHISKPIDSGYLYAVLKKYMIKKCLQSENEHVIITKLFIGVRPILLTSLLFFDRRKHKNKEIWYER
ncbi:MAG: response regulator [Eubacterium sp.]